MKSSIESVFRAGRAQKSNHKYTHWMHVIWIHGWCPIAKCATRPAVKQWNHHKSYVIAPMFGCACVCECVSIWITINQKHKDESCEEIALMTWRKKKRSNQIEDETGQCDVVVTPIVNSTATGKKTIYTNQNWRRCVAIGILWGVFRTHHMNQWLEMFETRSIEEYCFVLVNHWHRYRPADAVCDNVRPATTMCK